MLQYIIDFKNRLQ